MKQDTRQVNEILRALFAMPISAEQRLSLFFVWGLLRPEDSQAEKKGMAQQRQAQRRENPAYKKLECLRAAEYRKENPDKIVAWAIARDKEQKRIYDRIYAQEHHEERVAYKKVWAAENLDKVREYEKRRDPTKRKASLLKGAPLRRRQRRRRRAEDLEFRLLDNMRRRVRSALLGEIKKSQSTEVLLGCSILELRSYLEQQFQPGMSWESYGLRGWVVDHKMPCARFDLSKPEQQRKCFHYTNLQPLWAIDNWKKGAHVSD